MTLTTEVLVGGGGRGVHHGKGNAFFEPGRSHRILGAGLRPTSTKTYVLQVKMYYFRSGKTEWFLVCFVDHVNDVETTFLVLLRSVCAFLLFFFRE